MIHLDTHVALWLYTGTDQVRIPVGLRDRLEVEQLAISPMVHLELSFLREIGRFADEPSRLIGELHRAIGLKVDDTPFTAVVNAAGTLTFTRDPFDRIIAGQAIAAGADLATKDERLRGHLDIAVWDSRGDASAGDLGADH